MQNNKIKTKVINFTSKAAAEGFAKKVNGEVRIAKDNHPYVVFKTDGVYKGNNPDSYDEWWQENNLNGGFAYNGVTDDF